MVQDLFIIGATGKVGTTLIRQIFERRDWNRIKHDNPSRIVGLASSKKVLYNPEGIDYRTAMGFAEKKCGGQDNEFLMDLIPLAKRKSSDRKHLAFVDVTAMDDFMLYFQSEVMSSTDYGIVTANKKPLVDTQQYFDELTRDVNRYGYRCSVMAGAEAVDKMKDLRDADDLPKNILGCFSGTLGYICSELENGKLFSEVVANAKKLGYTEPNPAEDLSGEDVARKILILARTAGYRLEYEDIHLNPFIPLEYLKEKDSSKFMNRLGELDDYFAKRVLEASKNGMVLRYVAKFSNYKGKPRISVGLENVLKSSPLGLLEGTANKIIVETRDYGNKRSIIEAPGAGLTITARNIRIDLAHQIRERTLAKY